MGADEIDASRGRRRGVADEHRRRQVSGPGEPGSRHGGSQQSAGPGTRVGPPQQRPALRGKGEDPSFVGSYVPKLVFVDSGSASLAGTASGDAESRPWFDKEGEVVGRACVADGTHFVELDGVARFSFDATGPNVTAVPAPAAEKKLVAEYFRRWILPVAVHVRGLEVLHASAVLASGGVAAFSAASEAGKSTIAHGLGTRGLRIWTDDALAFDVDGDGPRAFALPYRLRLRPASATHFGLEPSTGGTITVESEPGVEEEAPIAVLFLLERRPVGPAVHVEPIEPVQAFPTLVERSYHFGGEESERKRAMLSRYLELASAVPVYRLSMATGLEHLEAVLDAVQERL